jgi:kynureninase
MLEIQKKTIHLTAYLEHLLLSGTEDATRAFRIITPSEPGSRGTQLSILLKPGRLDTLSAMLDDAGIVADKRKPDVIRVAPVPLYNMYSEVWKFVQIFKAALAKCENQIGEMSNGVAKVSMN